jgi:hypothetical protein
MKVFTYSQARQRLSAVLDTARKEKVLITRRGGDRFCLSYETSTKSPFDVPGIKTKATTRGHSDRHWRVQIQESQITGCFGRLTAAAERQRLLAETT